MAFQIKDFSSIAASAMNWVKSTTQKISDLNVGSIVRTMIEAVAAEIDELYQQMFIGLKESIPVATYNSFNFAALPAQPASGLVRVTVTSSAASVRVASGTLFSIANNPQTYFSSADAVIAPGGTYVDVFVTASSVGLAGNIASGKAFTLSPTPTNFVSATNQAAFQNGSEDETDDARKIRFNAFIAALSRGTVAALTYGLKLTAIYGPAGNLVEKVATVSIVEPWILDNTQPVSLVNCYIHNGVGSTSGALVTLARTIMYGYYDSNGVAVPGWKAAGVDVEVYAATETTLAVTGALTAAPGYVAADLRTAAAAAITAYIIGLPIGVTAIRAEIIAIVMNIDGVTNFIPSAPTGDTAVASSVKLMPGTITIT